jgi:hypothetical protein
MLRTTTTYTSFGLALGGQKSDFNFLELLLEIAYLFRHSEQLWK